MARQPLNEGLYHATVQAFTQMGMPAELAEPAAEVIATDSHSGTPDNPTERTQEQQSAVWAAWNWANTYGKFISALAEKDDTEEEFSLMTKPLGYFTNYTPGDGGLLGEMEEAWGSFFEKLKDNERLWLLARIAHTFWETTEIESENISDEVEEAALRAVRELQKSDVLGLIEALVNQLRYP